jgi:hypothetical protein
MALSNTSHTVKEHFVKCAPEIEETYEKLVSEARRLGPVREEAKKTSIHLVRKTAFAGVATRKNVLILTLKAASDLSSSRITKREQASANRWHLEVRVASPQEVDRELLTWLKRAYELAG